MREKLNLLQTIFAHYLHTGESTYQNWERGRAKTNAQAVLLIRMVQQTPETLDARAALKRIHRIPTPYWPFNTGSGINPLYPLAMLREFWRDLLPLTLPHISHSAACS